MLKNKTTIILITILVIVILFISKKKVNAMSAEKNSNGNQIKILAKQILRSDGQGSGTFGASRGRRKHNGIDLVAAVGENVFTSVGGKVKKIGLAYSGDNRFNSYHIELDNGLTMKLLYVKPLFKVGDRVAAGTIIATVQNIASKYGGGMINHVHVELISNGFTIDPTKYFI